MPSTKSRESRVRRRLARDGYRLWVPRGRHQAEFGPYAIVENDRNLIGPRGLSLDATEEWANAE